MYYHAVAFLGVFDYQLVLDILPSRLTQNVSSFRILQPCKKFLSVALFHYLFLSDQSLGRTLTNLQT